MKGKIPDDEARLVAEVELATHYGRYEADHVCWEGWKDHKRVERRG